MRRLARPTGLSREYVQQQHQQRRCIGRRPRLSSYPYGVVLHQGHAPLKKNFPPTFELPDLVLDLDAEDSPHVRSYDEEKDGSLQASKWGYDPTIDEINNEAKAMKKDLKHSADTVKQLTRAPFHRFRLSDHDIMAVALFKDAATSNSSIKDPRLSRLYLGPVLLGIPKAIRSHPNKVIPFMLHRQQQTLSALKDPSKRWPRVGDNEQEFSDEVDSCGNLVQLRRLYSRIDRPESGVEISSSLIDHVHSRLLVILRSEQATSADTLKFLNNVTIKRLSTNKELNRSMTLFGLQLASQLGLLSCILQYLQICLAVSFITDRAEGLALTRSQTGHAILAALQRGDATARGTRQQILTLLTGRGPGIQAPHASLFGLATEQDYETRQLFVALLGELGALRILVHHRRQRAQQHGVLHRVEEKPEGAEEAEQVFVKAFLRCAQLLGSVKDEEMSIDLTTPTGDVEQDAALDWQNINVVDAFYAKNGSQIPQPALRDLEEAVSASEVMDAFDKPDMGMVMAHLKGLVEKATAKASESASGAQASQSSTSPGETPQGDGSQAGASPDELPETP